MTVPKIVEAKAIGEFTIKVTFNNGDLRVYDIAPLLGRAPFDELRSQALFRAVQVEQGGHAIVWNDRIDLSEYEVWKNGVVPI